MEWDRKEHRWTKAEFVAAMRKLGLDMSDDVENVQMVYGNANVKMDVVEPSWMFNGGKLNGRWRQTKTQRRVAKPRIDIRELQRRNKRRSGRG